MAGLFGVGVLAALEEADLYNQIEAIYGVSAGALNGAYFLANQTELGASVYYDNLTSGFVKPLNLIPLVIKSLLRSGKQMRKNRHVVDINFLFEILEKQKRLNLNLARAKKIKLYAKLLDTSTGELLYKDVFDGSQPMSILKAAVSILPFFLAQEKVDGKIMVDGAVLEPLGLQSVIQRHPSSNIIAIINTRLYRNFGHRLRSLAEQPIINRYYPGIKKSELLQRDKKFNQEIRGLVNNPKVVIVSPNNPGRVRPNITRRGDLLTIYAMGIAQGKKLVDTLRP